MNRAGLNVAEPAADAASRPAPHPVVGRFAPTPSGHLHAGSIFSALMTWLDARAFGGEWFIRIDDIDAPRVLAGAEASIISELARIGLEPDRPIARQQGRGQRYREALEAFEPWRFACTCSRRDLSTAPRRFADGPVYPGTCRPTSSGRSLGPNRPSATCTSAPDAPASWRLNTDTASRTPLVLDDTALGHVAADTALLGGDFIVWRRDGQPNAVFAGWVDDLDAGVTRRVRGIDLLTVSLRQTLLQRLLDQGKAAPSSHVATWHHPLVRAPDGDKLAKSRGAPDSRAQPAPRVLAEAIARLPPGLIDDALHELLCDALRARSDDPQLCRTLLSAAVQATAGAIRSRTLRWIDDRVLDRPAARSLRGHASRD